MSEKLPKQAGATSAADSGYGERVEIVRRAIRQGVPLWRVEEQFDRFNAAGYSGSSVPLRQTSASNGK